MSSLKFQVLHCNKNICNLYIHVVTVLFLFNKGANNYMEVGAQKFISLSVEGLGLGRRLPITLLLRSND